MEIISEKANEVALSESLFCNEILVVIYNLHK